MTPCAYQSLRSEPERRLMAQHQQSSPSLVSSEPLRGEVPSRYKVLPFANQVFTSACHYPEATEEDRCQKQQKRTDTHPCVLVTQAQASETRTAWFSMPKRLTPHTIRDLDMQNFGPIKENGWPWSQHQRVAQRPTLLSVRQPHTSNRCEVQPLTIGHITGHGGGPCSTLSRLLLVVALDGPFFHWDDPPRVSGVLCQRSFNLSKVPRGQGPPPSS